MTESIDGGRWPRTRATEPVEHARRARSLMRVAAALLMVGVIAVALIGTWQAIVTLASPSVHGDHAGIGERTTSAFGFMTVQSVDVLDGLTAEDVGGMTHGINDFVPADQAQIEVAVRLENISADAVRVDPGQFALAVAGSAATVRPTGATVRPMSLPARTTVDVSVTFVVPRAGGAMNLQYTDPVTGSRTDIPVGRVDQATGGEGGSHVH
jgi:hypothetical protein